MAVIGFASHAGRHNAVELAKSTAVWLEEKGHDAVLLPELDLLREARSEHLRGLDLLVSLGGDGTMLRTVGLALGTEIPVLGVNFGHFGYLTAVEPDGLRHAIDRFIEGNFHLHRRMTVDVSVLSDGAESPRLSATGLNDIVLARPSGTHTINASVAISGERFLRYAADALIVATATGTTGYNLSARGPVVSPTLRCLVLTPVSPHMLFDRSLVLDSSATVSMELDGRFDADLIVDGVPRGQLEVGGKLVCSAGTRDALLVSFGDRDFETVLKNKFHLADR
ncbi:MAG TPA: NAD(+)/NADH kinase [Acidimicrobiales bacterium]|nr:NAD(+)/NADH kinase [Acidimicrobiales bacterium]